MVLACDVFYVPIRKDIIHQDNREWIFVSSHIMKEGKLSRDS
uniref:Uncharacterized protein n=1 Tax=Rhizophora mucronata TaxID=61149 RepID=A0A2P2J766_RHIMU